VVLTAAGHQRDVRGARAVAAK